MPELQKVAHELAGRGLALVTIALDGSKRAYGAVATRSGLTAPVILGDDALRRRLNVSAYPWTILLDRDGKPVHAIRGGRTAEELRKTFERFL